jgi:voltage-gated potassium channel
MKVWVSQFAELFRERRSRRNLRALFQYLLFLAAVITVFAIGFHVVMLRYEGQEHTWLTGFYWALTVMSTLGFGDITFHTDAGRLFSMAVLLSGLVLLLIMLPFAFIQYFYAPWLEAQVRTQAPREVPERTKGHVILCRYDSVAPGLIEKLRFAEIPYFVLEPDPVKAAAILGDEISVVTGEIDSQETYERLRAGHARMVLANAEDTTNTNIALTLREVAPDVPIVAFAEDWDSVDILEFSGATRVLPLKHNLGEQLAARTVAGAGSAHVTGGVGELRIFEFVVHDSGLTGKTLAETEIRQKTGVNIVGVWEQGKLQRASAGLRLSDLTVLVGIGSDKQVARLNELLGTREPKKHRVLIIGGGRVGQAAAAWLRRRGVPVQVVDKTERLRKTFAAGVDFIAGDAADRDVLREAHLEESTAVMLTTNEDAVNVYLTVYCRRLRPSLHIVTRITHERNLEAIYRAGADTVLSYSSLGREYVMSLMHGRDPVMVGEGADFFLVPVPRALAGKTLKESGIGSRTGLIVIGVQDEQDGSTISPPPEITLPRKGRLMMLGSAEQRSLFAEKFS